jgi:hypothetical protein
MIFDDSLRLLVELWRSAGHLFPLQFCRASRPWRAPGAGGPGPEFFSAMLACGHLVRVPAERARKPGNPNKCRALLPCYKCWLKKGNFVLLPCSFCGGAHLSVEACARV